MGRGDEDRKHNATITGYVVWWTSVRGHTNQSGIITSLQEATRMHEDKLVLGHHPVTIFAVYADGTEQRVPSYEEALAERGTLEAGLAMAKVDLVAVRDAAMAQISERDAEIERLRAEHATAGLLLALTSAQLRGLANDLDDRVGDMRIDEEQIREEAGYDKLAAWGALAEHLRAEAKRREAAK